MLRRYQLRGNGDNCGRRVSIRQRPRPKQRRHTTPKCRRLQSPPWPRDHKRDQPSQHSTRAKPSRRITGTHRQSRIPPRIPARYHRQFEPGSQLPRRAATPILFLIQLHHASRQPIHHHPCLLPLPIRKRNPRRQRRLPTTLLWRNLNIVCHPMLNLFEWQVRPIPGVQVADEFRQGLTPSQFFRNDPKLLRRTLLQHCRIRPCHPRRNPDHRRRHITISHARQRDRRRDPRPKQAPDDPKSHLIECTLLTCK